MSSKKQLNLEELLFFISKKGNRVALSSIVRISPTTIYLNTGSTLNIKDPEDLAQLEAKLVAFEEYKLSKQQADLDAKIAKLTKADLAEHLADVTAKATSRINEVFNTIINQSEQTSERITGVVSNQIDLVGTLTTNLNTATRNISNLSSQMSKLTSSDEDLEAMMESITRTKNELEGTIKLLKECLDV